MKLAGVVLAALLSLLLLYFLLIRPWYETWGATAEEVARGLPGDEFAPGARSVETRAISIRAAPEVVWPWLAQLGQDRAGLYAYPWLEELAGSRAPGRTRLLGLPDPRPGDAFWTYPRSARGGVVEVRVAAVERGRALVLWARAAPGLLGALLPHGVWAFVLEPRTDGSTRLFVRRRAGDPAHGAGLLAWLGRALLFDPLHFALERKLLTTVKSLAEGRPPPPAWLDVLEVVLWGATCAVGIAALAAILLRRRAFWRPLSAGTAALFVLTLLFFARPPLTVAVVLVVGLRVVLAWALKGEAGPLPRPAFSTRKGPS